MFLLSDFNSLFELSVALNIAYTSLPQLLLSLQGLFLKRVEGSNIKIQNEIQVIRNKITVIKEEELSVKERKIVEQRMDIELRDITDKGNSFIDNLKNNLNKFSEKIRVLFFAVSILSVVFLYIASIGVTVSGLVLHGIFLVCLAPFIITPIVYGRISSRINKKFAQEFEKNMGDLKEIEEHLSVIEKTPSSKIFISKLNKPKKIDK